MKERLFYLGLHISFPGGTEQVTDDAGFITRSKSLPTEALRPLRKLKNAVVNKLARMGEPFHNGYVIQGNSADLIDRFLCEKQKEFYLLAKESSEVLEEELKDRFLDSCAFSYWETIFVKPEQFKFIVRSLNAKRALSIKRRLGTVPMEELRSDFLEIVTSLSRWNQYFPDTKDLEGFRSLGCVFNDLSCYEARELHSMLDALISLGSNTV